MKIPHSVVGATRPSGQSLAYLRGSTPDLSAITRGLKSFGGAIGQLAEDAERKNSQTERLSAMSEFSKFDLDVKSQITEMKRQTPPEATDFVPRADKLFNDNAEQFIGRLPGHLQDEFRFRVEQVRHGIVADALTFQYDQQDAFAKAKIEEAYQAAQLAVDADPTALATATQRLRAIIAEADLPLAAEGQFPGKEELAKTYENALAAIQLKRRVQDARRQTGFAAPQVMVAGGNGEEMAKTILRQFEGFREKPYWDVNNWRVGYGSDTFITSTGQPRQVGTGTRVTREQAEADLTHRLMSVEGKQVRTQVNEVADWEALAPNVQAALYSVGYNYGSLPASVVSAVKSGDVEQIADAVGSLSANPKRRAQEAAIIRGGRVKQVEEIMNDPTYDGVSLDTRQAIIEDVDREIAKEERDLEAARREEFTGWFNSLLNDLHTGNAGQTDIDAAVASGRLRDYDDIYKAERVLAARDDQSKGAELIEAFAAGQGTYNSAINNDDWNKWMQDRDGLSKLAASDQDFFNGAILPLVDKFQDIPTTVSAQLTAMAHSSDPNAMMYAYRNIATLTDHAGSAARARFQEDALLDKAQVIRTASGLGIPNEELVKFARGGRDAAGVRASQAMDQEADTIMRGADFDIQEKIKTHFETGGFLGLFETVPQLERGSEELVAAEEDFRAAFKFAFRAHGDAGLAERDALAKIDRIWGATNLGDRGYRLMRYPPEKLYPLPPGFDTAVFKEDIEKVFNIKGAETFELKSDERTERERIAFQQGKLKHWPTYAVTKYTENGEPVILPARWGGALPEAEPSPNVPEANPPVSRGAAVAAPSPEPAPRAVDEKSSTLDKHIEKQLQSPEADIDILTRDLKGRIQRIKRGNAYYEVVRDEKGRAKKMRKLSEDEALGLQPKE